jgi:hypothetical protein
MGRVYFYKGVDATGHSQKGNLYEVIKWVGVYFYKGVDPTGHAQNEYLPSTMDYGPSTMDFPSLAKIPLQPVKL